MVSAARAPRGRGRSSDPRAGRGGGAGWAVPPRGGRGSAGPVCVSAQGARPGLPPPPHTPGARRRRRWWRGGELAATGNSSGGEFPRRGSPGISFSRLKRSPPWLPLLISLVVATESQSGVAELVMAGLVRQSDSAGPGGVGWGRMGRGGGQGSQPGSARGGDLSRLALGSFADSPRRGRRPALYPHSGSPTPGWVGPLGLQRSQHLAKIRGANTQPPPPPWVGKGKKKRGPKGCSDFPGGPCVQERYVLTLAPTFSDALVPATH
jgi:hypothetical protein